MESNNNNNNTYKIVSISIIALLLLLTGYLLWNKSQNTNVIATQDAKMVEMEKNRAELEKNYYESLAQLEEMRGDNTELNEKIDSAKIELKKQKDQISNLLATSKDYKAIKAKINEMRQSNDEFQKEISALKAENDQLTQSNMQLSTEKDLLATKINEERKNSDNLSAKNSNLEEQNAALKQQQKVLSKKVSKSSVIKVSDILVEGYKINSRGKEVSQRRARDIEILRICFKTGTNDLLQNSHESFYIKIINPSGETVVVPSAGSGVIESGDEEGKQISYSIMKEFNYESVEAVSCASWKPNIQFESGTYNIEIYNKGYLAGKSTFKLK